MPDAGDKSILLASNYRDLREVIRYSLELNTCTNPNAYELVTKSQIWKGEDTPDAGDKSMFLPSIAVIYSYDIPLSSCRAAHQRRHTTIAYRCNARRVAVFPWHAIKVFFNRPTISSSA
jgi:hypothetical protein